MSSAPLGQFGAQVAVAIKFLTQLREALEQQGAWQQ
jgi:hypothetical protein